MGPGLAGRVSSPATMHVHARVPVHRCGPAPQGPPAQHGHRCAGQGGALDRQHPQRRPRPARGRRRAACPLLRRAVQAVGRAQAGAGAQAAQEHGVCRIAWSMQAGAAGAIGAVHAIPQISPAPTVHI
eukprot:366536-Chlamydomonas_euryale.AAC.2